MIIGALAGAVVGAGFLMSLHLLPRQGDIIVIAMSIPVIFAFWMAVAGGLIAGGFRLAGQNRAWWATGAGGAVWVVVIVSLVFGGAFSKHNDLPFPPVALAVSCAAYAIAALCTGVRAR
ncbi:hypothetical protein [Lentzea flava]|uniref:hypothetical protein n=1 Tax=Lentzea flava TaxID=103732 RepID=UPI0016701FB0|nr:hypothetical protein [Lentzea flava]